MADLANWGPKPKICTLFYSKIKMESGERTKCSSPQTNSNDGTRKRIRFQITPVFAKMPDKPALFIIKIKSISTSPAREVVRVNPHKQ